MSDQGPQRLHPASHPHLIYRATCARVRSRRSGMSSRSLGNVLSNFPRTERHKTPGSDLMSKSTAVISHHKCLMSLIQGTLIHWHPNTKPAGLLRPPCWHFLDFYEICNWSYPPKCNHAGPLLLNQRPQSPGGTLQVSYERWILAETSRRFSTRTGRCHSYICLLSDHMTWEFIL